MASTHKSSFRPQREMLLSNDAEMFPQVDAKVYPGVVDNIHSNRVATLTFALLGVCMLNQSMKPSHSIEWFTEIGLVQKGYSPRIV